MEAPHRTGCKSEGPSATALSRYGSYASLGSAVFRLARRSLAIAGVSLFAPSCIIADPPEYSTASQRAPVLDLYNASPAILKILEVSTNQVVPINVPLRSEDAGEQLTALLFLDYGTTPSNVPVGYAPIPASTYDDSNRAVSTPWSAPGERGCHRLTLLVCHQSSFNYSTYQILPSRTNDVALATWVVAVDDGSGTPVDLASCPEPSP
jgi:hypothetical protein